MFSACIDTSGNKRSPVMTMVGFVSRVGKWDRFQVQWSDLLHNHGVSRLHMTDFVASEREFKNWAGPAHSERRKRFLEDAVETVRKHVNKGFAISIVLSDYHEVNGQFEVQESIGPPFAVCGMTLLGRIKKWAERKKTDPQKILYLIEDGDDDKGQFMTLGRASGYKIQPLAKGDSRAFEACDMAAWKVSAALRNAESKKGTFEDAVRSLEPIAPIVHSNSAMDMNRLILMCEQGGIPRRAPGSRRRPFRA